MKGTIGRERCRTSENVAARVAKSLAGRPATYVAGGMLVPFHAQARASRAWVVDLAAEK